jgi:phosphoenolpyruvate synthase/pyruvate phosphate dikinase
MASAEPHYVRWFSGLGIQDVALVGGKNASLGETVSCLSPSASPCPTAGVHAWRAPLG